MTPSKVSSSTTQKPARPTNWPVLRPISTAPTPQNPISTHDPLNPTRPTTTIPDLSPANNLNLTPQFESPLDNHHGEKSNPKPPDPTNLQPIEGTVHPLPRILHLQTFLSQIIMEEMSIPLVIDPEPIIPQIELKIQRSEETRSNSTPWMLEMHLEAPILLWSLTASHLSPEERSFVDNLIISFNSSGYPISFMDPLNILVWNIHGGGSQNFIRTMKELIRIHNPALLLLIETKVNNETAERSIRLLGFNNFHLVETLGFASGLWLIWRTERISVDILASNNQVIHALIKRQGDANWIFFGIYASPNAIKRKKMWEFLVSTAQNHNLPWLAADDFSEMASSNEKFGGASSSHQHKGLVKCMEDCAFLDLGYSGPKFTRTGNLRGYIPVRERLYRGLCNEIGKEEKLN